MDIATSEMFRFLVGPDEQEFWIHSALVACQSAALKAMVDGNFKETTDGCARLPDVDTQTFTSFWQFVYTGSYANPEPRSPSTPGLLVESSEAQRLAESTDVVPADIPFSPEPAQQTHPEPVVDEWNWGLSNTKKQKKKLRQLGSLWEDEPPEEKTRGTITKQMAQWNEFKDSWRIKLASQPQKTALGTNASPQNRDLPLHHARVYALSECYGIAELEDASFSKLHNSLVDYDLSKNGHAGIIALLRYCFDELSPDRLKQLVAHYIACKFEYMWKSNEFQEFLEEHGCVSRMVMQLLLPRLD